MVITANNISSLVTQVNARQALDDMLPEDVKLAVTAEVLKRAGAAINVANTNPRRVLQALANIEKLTRLTEGSVQRDWLAIRALGLKAGQKLAGPQLDNPVFVQIVAQSGLIPTIDPNEGVHGWVGAFTNTDATRFNDKTRIVNPKPFSVATRNTQLFSEPAQGSPMEDLLTNADRLNAKAVPAQSNAVELDYTVLDEPNIKAGEGDTLFAEYRLSRISIPNAKPHPTALVEPAALASVALPKPTYKPVIDPALVARGVLSDVQLESIIYAGEAHSTFLPRDLKTGLAFRRGFLVGHGAGSGKGRIVLGIILDNWNQGRPRGIVFSENQKLFKEATRDWVSLGGRPADLMRHIDFDNKGDIPARNGILFTTYALIRDPNRLKQIIDWFGTSFDGAIVMDECQAGRNAMDNGKQAFGGGNSVSQQGEAMIDIQAQLPNSRVVYSSATSAMEIVGLGYAQRLGLWGTGTSFPEASNFFTQMEEGGIGALELVARDMKAMGIYTAANLSMEGVGYERHDIKLSDAERKTYDTLAEAWMMVNVKMMQTLVKQGILVPHKHLKGTPKGTWGAGNRHSKTLTGVYRQAKARFFQTVLAAMKMRRLLPTIALDLAQGNSPIIQITNTNEASLNRALLQSSATDLSDLDASPREILIGFVMNNWPVMKLQLQRQPNGQQAYAPVIGPNGQPTFHQQALTERDAIIAQLKTLDIPDCPLEQIITFFGKDQVAEVTGRTKRVVPGATSGSRVVEDRSQTDVEEDVRLFQADRKKVLIFSTSGGTGVSYHAANTAKNQRLRRHYLLQAGWRADQAIQGLGRSHRSDEKQPPVYILVQADLWSDRRMISNVASGMEALGALTRGQRHAAAQELFTQDDNLESELATSAWKKFLEDLKAANVPGLSIEWFERETGIPLRHNYGEALADSDMPTVKRFLTAMGGMTCDRQEAFGEAYRKRLEDVRMEAIKQGTFDRGVEWIQADSIMVASDDIVWRDPRTDATTRLLQLVKTEKADPILFERAREKCMAYGGNARVAINGMTNRVAVIGFPESNRFSIDSLDEILVVTPRGEQIMKRYRFEREMWRTVASDEARRIWDIELTQVSKNAETWFYLVTGMLLPIWDKLPKSMAQVYRLETDDGQRVLGRLVPEEWASSFVKRLSGGNVTADESLAVLENGGTATLANGWVVFSSKNRDGEPRISLAPIALNDNPEAWVDDLRALGVEIREPVPGKHIFRLPTEESKRAETWKAITEKWPVMGASGFATAA